MGRKKLQLNIARKPGFAESWVIKNIKSGLLYRATALCSPAHAPKRGDADAMPGRDFQAADPFFKVKYAFPGTRQKDYTYITFLVGTQHAVCRSDDGEWEWLDIKVKEARETGLEIHNDTGVEEETETPVAVETEVETADETPETNEVQDLTDSGFAKVTGEKPSEKKKGRRTVYKIAEGRVVSLRTRKEDLPEGHFETREEAEEALAKTETTEV